MDEVVKSLKSGQDTLKGRIKELAEALVALSSKAQARLLKLESGSRRSDTGGVGASESGEGVDKRASMTGVSAAHKALDQQSSQVRVGRYTSPLIVPGALAAGRLKRAPTPWRRLRTLRR